MNDLNFLALPYHEDQQEILKRIEEISKSNTLEKVKINQNKQNKTKQNKQTKQNKTKQNTTKPNINKYK